MKKNAAAMILLGTMMTAAAVTGCGKSAPAAGTEATTEAGTTAETTETAETTKTADKTEAVVKPVAPLKTAEDALADGGYSVSFTADDLVEKDGGYELTAEVYEYDRYEMDAIDGLTSGSKIEFCNEEVTVNEVEKDPDSGSVMINGGIENGGIDLKEDDGLYRTVTMDDYPVYYSVGKVTIPLAEDVTFEDQANSEQESDVPVVGLKDLPNAIKNSELPFSCNDTVITVRQEQIVQIIRYWVP